MPYLANGLFYPSWNRYSLSIAVWLTANHWPDHYNIPNENCSLYYTTVVCTAICPFPQLVFYTQIDETVIAAAFATDYATAKSRPFDLDVTSVASIIIVDLMASGFCVSISFEKMRQYLITKHEISPHETDFPYTAIFWLRGNPAAVDDGKFYMKYYFPGEVISNGECAALDIPSDAINYGHTKLSILSYR